MPYVKEVKRGLVDRNTEQLINDLQLADKEDLLGLLNYVVSRIVAAGCSPGATWRYSQLMADIGTLECAKLELYRRVGGPKEDLAIQDNGDVEEYENWMRKRFPGDYR